MGVTGSGSTCSRCAARLARDNTDRICSPCQRIQNEETQQIRKVSASVWADTAVIDCLQGRDWGGFLAAYRDAISPRLTQAGLAELLGLTQGQISRLERHVAVTTDLAKLQTWAGALGIPEHLLWFRLDDPHRARGQPERAQQAGPPVSTASAGEEMHRRDLIKLAGIAAIPSADLAELFAAPNGGRRLRRADVETIRAITATYRGLDNRFGGGHSRSAVLRYLQLEVLPCVHSGDFREAVRRDLFSATAELLQLAGWMAADVGEHQTSVRAMKAALELGAEAGNTALSAEILAGLSHQAAYRRLAGPALDYAEGARAHAERSGSRPLLAECLAMQAHAHALRGDTPEAERALSRAERQFSVHPPAERPDWLAYFDEAYLAAMFAHTYKDLGATKKALDWATRSLQMREGYTRGRVFNLALLASVLADMAELERACVVGTEAVELASEIDSTRAETYLADFRRRLGRFSGHPLVAEYDEIAACYTRQP
jgi:transcriptional regulator with XRE-family HTH domain